MSKNKMLIGVTGLANSGKDTTGDFLVKNYDNWEKMSFANHLKDVASLLFGFDRKMLAGETPEDRAIREQPDKFWSEKMGKDFTPRYALQFLGTNLLRNQMHKNIWVDCLERKIMESDKNIVITDVRFPNEIDMIRSLGGEIWRVERPELPTWFRKVEGHFNIWGNLSYKQSIGLFSSLDDIPQDIVLEIGNTCSIQESQSDYIWDGNKWLQTYDGLEDINHSEILDVLPELCHIHESEWKWVGYDKPNHILQVNGEFEYLYSQIRQIMEKE